MHLPDSSVGHFKANWVYIVVLVFLITAASGMLYCHYFFRFWTHKDASSFKSLAEFKSANIRGHRGRQVLVHRDFVPALQQIDRLAAENNIAVAIINAYRRKNQDLSRTVVRPASRSNHLAGHAIDMNLKHRGHYYTSDDLKNENQSRLPGEIQTFLKALKKYPGARWGGDFIPQDPVHVDSGLNQADPARWEVFVAGCHDDYTKAGPKWKSWLRF